jgi:hypothetical protein
MRIAPLGAETVAVAPYALRAVWPAAATTVDQPRKFICASAPPPHRQSTSLDPDAPPRLPAPERRAGLEITIRNSQAPNAAARWAEAPPTQHDALTSSRPTRWTDRPGRLHRLCLRGDASDPAPGSCLDNVRASLL